MSLVYIFFFVFKLYWSTKNIELIIVFLKLINGRHYCVDMKHQIWTRTNAGKIVNGPKPTDISLINDNAFHTTKPVVWILKYKYRPVRKTLVLYTRWSLSSNSIPIFFVLITKNVCTVIIDIGQIYHNYFC